MRKVLLCLFLVPAVAFAGTVAADRRTSPLDPLEKALGVDGGTLQRLASLRTVAECTGPQGAFSTEVVSERPLRVEFRQQSHRGEQRLLLDRLGPKVWDQAAGDWREAPVALRDFIRGHEFHLVLFELGTRFQDFAEGALKTVEGRACRTVTMQTRAGLPASICLATDTHRPLALRFVPAPGEAPIRVLYRDWKKMEGLWFFQGFTLTQGEDLFTYRYTALEPTLTPSEADPAMAQDWTVGEWRGVRRDGGERTPEAEAAMTMQGWPRDLI